MIHTNRINLRRCAYAGLSANAVASQFGYLQLKNNTQYAEYLSVRFWIASTAGTNQVTINNDQVDLGGTTAPATPVMPSDAPPPGLVTGGTTLTQYLTGFTFQVIASQPIAWPLAIPFALIPPNWCFKIQLPTANVVFKVGIWWEAIKPEDLDPEMFAVANLTAALAQS